MGAFATSKKQLHTIDLDCLVQVEVPTFAAPPPVEATPVVAEAQPAPPAPSSCEVPLQLTSGMGDSNISHRIERLNQITLAISSQRDVVLLLEMILQGAKELTSADAGTIYTLADDHQTLRFEIVHTDSLGIAKGGSNGPVDLPDLPLYRDGVANLSNVAAFVCLKDVTINLPNAYDATDFDFSGTRLFDQMNNYCSQSFLTVPLRNHEEEIIGVLQLINAKRPQTGVIEPFSEESQHLAEILASQAAIAITNQRIFERLNQIGTALSSQRDINRLLEMILLGAKELTRADGGTIYSVTDQQTLKFEIIRTDSLGIAMGGTTGKAINFPELPLYKQGEPNLNNVAAYVALKDTTINIPDAYEAEGFDFSGTRKFDQGTGFRSKSFLTVPLKNNDNEIIGVLQLINSIKPKSGEIQPFSQRCQSLAESLASQAAIAITNQRLIQSLKELFESFIQVIATSIDDKSPYTGGHCNRVPIIAEMLAESARQSDVGELKDFTLTDEEMYEMRIAAWLHDCGKVVTPEFVVDKATKLETIYDRINTVDTRFEVLLRDAELAHLRRKLELVGAGQLDDLANLDATYQEQVKQLQDDREFIRRSNIGGEFMSADHQERVRRIARYEWRNANGELESFLSENEVFNLNIPRGTLTDAERQIINNHVVASLKMLNALPFPKHLKRVPDIAGSHHERLDGGGYPRGLKKDEMSVQARILAIADVFEALTAKDRPYKPGKTLSQALKILGFMKKDSHIDPDLFKVFIDEKLYLQYAEKYLSPEQIDAVDPLQIPGYVP